MEDIKLQASFPLSMEANHPRTPSYDVYQQVLNFDSMTGTSLNQPSSKNFCDYCYSPSTNDMKHFPICSHYICSSCININSASSYLGFRNVTCPLCPQELTNKPIVNSISNPTQKSMGYIPMNVFPPSPSNHTIDAFSALLGPSTAGPAINGHSLGISNAFTAYAPPPTLTSSYANPLQKNINTFSNGGNMLSMSLQSTTSSISNNSPNIYIGSLPTNPLTSIVQGSMNGLHHIPTSMAPNSAINHHEQSPTNPLMCSCDEGVSPATAQCLDCLDYLCEICVIAHRKVRITREHRILNLHTNDIMEPSSSVSTATSSLSPSTNSCSPASNKSSSDSAQFISNTYHTPKLGLLSLDDHTISDLETHGQCVKHERDQLIYFCQTCGILICKSCLIDDHTHHNYGYIRETYKRFRPAIDELVSKSKVEILLLENSVKTINKLGESTRTKSDECMQKMRETITQYIQALRQHEDAMTKKITTITQHRLDALERQKSSLEITLNSLKAVSLSAEKALKEENKGEVLASRIHLVSNLRERNSTVCPRNPTEDDSYIIKSSNTPVEKMLSSLIRVTTAPFARLCTAEGDGLKHPKYNKPCTITITTKDRYGHPCIECKEKLFVQMKSEDGHNVPVEVANDNEGIYNLSFKPRIAGEHHLILAIRGQHIEGSPFILQVDGGRDYAKFTSCIPFSFGSEGSEEGQLCRPWGICVTSSGDIIIGDRSNHRVQIFSPSGTPKFHFGSEGSKPGEFCRPAGVDLTKEDNIVVADKDNHRVQIFRADGNFILTFGSKGSNDNQMIYPYDVAVTPDNGRIIVSDSGNHRLLIFNHLGVLLAKFGYKGYLCGNFDSPRGVTVNEDGHIILTDFNVHHILVIHPNGRTAQIIGGQGSGNGQLMRPQGVAVDSMGNIVVADTRNHRIVVFHPHGHFIAKYGNHGQGPGEFDRPTSVTVLPDGKFAVVDFGNSRIQIF